jgi:chromosome segregation ATPase
MTTPSSAAVSDWKAYHTSVRTRRNITNTTAQLATSIPFTATSNTTATAAATTNWQQKYQILLQQTQNNNTTQQQQATHTKQQHQVQHELLLARQKSQALTSQVQALEISAAELNQITQDRDNLVANLNLAMSRVEELEIMNQDLRHANGRLSEGLDTAMASAQEERTLLKRRAGREKVTIEELEKNAANAGYIAATAQDKVNESRVQMEEAMRVRVHLESELKAIKEQLVMERHVASNKVQEFASKLQIALTARDENAHTYQLALSESNEQKKALETEVSVLRNIPSETNKLKRKLKKSKKRIKAYERQVVLDTEAIRRDTNIALLHNMGLGRMSSGRQSGVENGGKNGLNYHSNGGSNENNSQGGLMLQSIAGKELMFSSTLAKAKRKKENESKAKLLYNRIMSPRPEE